MLFYHADNKCEDDADKDDVDVLKVESSSLMMGFAFNECNLICCFYLKFLNLFF